MSLSTDNDHTGAATGGAKLNCPGAWCRLRCRTPASYVNAHAVQDAALGHCASRELASFHRLSKELLNGTPCDLIHWHLYQMSTSDRCAGPGWPRSKTGYKPQACCAIHAALHSCTSLPLLRCPCAHGASSKRPCFACMHCQIYAHRLWGVCTVPLEDFKARAASCRLS
jgi:hypothetical protein